MTIRLLRLRDALALALVLAGLAASLQAQGGATQTAAAPESSKTTTEQKTSVEVVTRAATEGRTPYTADELKAFLVVGVAFALAWVIVSMLREETRRKEIELKRTEALAQIKTLLKVLDDFTPRHDPPQTAADLIPSVKRILDAVAEECLKKS